MIWSKDNLKRLEDVYFAGWTLNQIAREFGKTPTAINKILTRSGIRPKRPKWNRDPIKPHHFEREWVHIRTVISYLMSIGMDVVSLDSSKDNPSNRRFLFNKTMISSTKLLFLANRDRVLKNKSTYLVSGITWL